MKNQQKYTCEWEFDICDSLNFRSKLAVKTFFARSMRSKKCIHFCFF